MRSRDVVVSAVWFLLAAAVLALLLAILEIDLHRARLHSMGLVSDTDTVEPIFILMGP